MKFSFFYWTSSSNVEMPGLEFKVFGEIFQIAERFNYLRWYRVPVSELVQTCRQTQ
jgi:hypothetical protein